MSDANGMNSDGTPVDPAVEFSGGIFTATDTTQTPNQTLVYVFGTPGNDTVTINNSSVQLTSSALTASLSLTAVCERERNRRPHRGRQQHDLRPVGRASRFGSMAATATTPSPAETAAIRSWSAAART